MRCRNAGVEAAARERADLAFGVAKNPIARVSILARFSGPSRGRFRPGHNLYLLAMTVAVVSEVQVPKNGCFIAAEAVPGVTPGCTQRLFICLEKAKSSPHPMLTDSALLQVALPRYFDSLLRVFPALRVSRQSSVRTHQRDAPARRARRLQAPNPRALLSRRRPDSHPMP